MMTENTLIINKLPAELKHAIKLVYDNCGFELMNLKVSAESSAYGACSFELNGKAVQHRVSKITPTKVGQFVTIWKRNQEGITAPFDILDNIDFLIISSRSGDNFGQFIFPKSILAEKELITLNGREGKRGVRVYPPWDITTNKQATNAQSWQTKYFVTIKNGCESDLTLIKKLFNRMESPGDLPFRFKH